MVEFVTFEEDKFKKQTTYKCSRRLRLNGSNLRFWRRSCDLKYRRIVIMPDLDSLVMDICIADNNDWTHFSDGQIILLIDGEAVTLEAHENWHRCVNVIKSNTLSHIESCYFEMSKELLKRICDSKSFCMKLYAGNVSIEVDNVNKVVVYSKLFYNAVYDNSAYTDVVEKEKSLGEFTGEFTGGCMGMLALMITMAGAAIGGICALV